MTKVISVLDTQLIHTLANTLVQPEPADYNMQALASANHALPLTILPCTYLTHARPGHL